MVECPHSHALHRLIMAIFCVAFLISHSPSLAAPFAPLLAFIRLWDSLTIMLSVTYLLLLLLLLLINMGCNDGDNNSGDDLQLQVDGSSITAASSSSARKITNPAEVKTKQKSPDCQPCSYTMMDDLLSQSPTLQIMPFSSTDEPTAATVYADPYFAHKEENSNHHLTTQLIYPDPESSLNRIQRNLPPTGGEHIVDENNKEGLFITPMYIRSSLIGSHGPNLKKACSKENSRLRKKSKYTSMNKLEVSAVKSEQEALIILSPSPGSDSSVNKKADAFIKHFREQIRLQQAQSFKRQRNMP